MLAVLAPVALGPRHKGLGDGVGRWRWAVNGTVVGFLRMSVSKARRLWPAGGPLWEAESFLRRGGGAGAALEGGCSPGHRGPGGVLPHILVSWRRGSSVTVLQTGKLAQTIGGRERI